MTNLELAKYAFTEAQDERVLNNLTRLDQVHFDRAKALVEQGFDYLLARDEIDPRVFAKDMAQFAVLEYTKAKLSGQNPEVSVSFLEAKKRWRRKAMAAFHRQEYAQDTADDDS